MTDKFDREQASLVAKFENEHSQRLEQAAKKGEIDGLIDLPTLVEDSAVYEGIIFAEYTDTLGELQRELGDYLETYHKDIGDCKEELAELDNDPSLIAKKLTEVERQETSRIKNITDDFERKDEALQDLQKPILVEFQKSKQELEDVQKKVGRKELNISLKSETFYYILLTIFGILELPINFKTFEQFKESTIMTYLIAGTLVAGVPIVSHFVGMGVKQKDDTSRAFIYKVGKFLVGLICILGGVGSINRTFVIKGVSIDISATPEFLNVLQTNATDIIFFFVLSLLLLIIGIIASYSHHDQSYELEAAHKKFAKTQKVFDDEIRPLKEEEEQLVDEKNRTIQQAENRFHQEKINAQNYRQDLKARLSNAITEFDGILTILKGMEKEISANYNACVLEYRETNRNHRRNHKKPTSFEKDPKPLELIFKGIPEQDDNTKVI